MGRLGGVTVRYRMHEFDSRLFRYQVTTLVKLFYTHVPLSPSSINWYPRKLGGKQPTTWHSGHVSGESATATGTGPWMTFTFFTFLQWLHTSYKSSCNSKAIVFCGPWNFKLSNVIIHLSTYLQNNDTFKDILNPFLSFFSLHASYILQRKIIILFLSSANNNLVKNRQLSRLRASISRDKIFCLTNQHYVYF